MSRAEIKDYLDKIMQDQIDTKYQLRHIDEMLQWMIGYIAGIHDATTEQSDL